MLIQFACSVEITIDASAAFLWLYPYIYLFGHALFIIIVIQDIVSDDLITSSITRLAIYIMLCDVNTHYISCHYILSYNHTKSEKWHPSMH